MEKYLFSKNSDFRKLICKFRISDHALAVETGRYKNIPRENRLCNTCNILDDEQHFLFDCTLNQNIRENYFHNINLDFTLDTNTKSKTILNPETDEQVKFLGSYLKQAFTLRTGGT